MPTAQQPATTADLAQAERLLAGATSPSVREALERVIAELRAELAA